MIEELKTRFKGGTGLIDEMDPNVPFADELGLLGGVELPKEFKVEGLEFPEQYKLEGMEYEYQGKTMTCVANATTTMAEQYLRQKTGEIHKFSQTHLFFNSGGGYRGSSISRNLETARTQGLISYSKLPLPENPYGIAKDWFGETRRVAEDIPFDDSYKIPGYVKIKGDWNSLKTAMFLYQRPILVAVRISGDYYSNMSWENPGGGSNHVLLLAGWDKLNRPIMFDTLNYVRKSEGYRTFAPGYEFPVGYMIKTLDEDWKEKRDQKRKKFEYCLNHYGKPRRLADEQKNAMKMQEEFKKFNNQSVYEAAGKLWTIAVNMVTYGGYSISYRKFGKWMSGDIINMTYDYRRKGKLIFNPDKERGDEGWDVETEL